MANTARTEHPVKISDYRGRNIFMIGISGSSMSGLAQMLKQKKFHVSGSSDVYTAKVKELREKGIPVTVGHRAENVKKAALAVYTTAIPADNPELMECRRRNIPMLDRPALLGEIMEEYPLSAAVSGTHGKTTTTSMLAQILLDDGMDPTIHIGGELPLINSGVHIGNSDIFVTEACEYKRAFFDLRPKIAIVLNIDRDHLDCYKDIDEIEETFGKFMNQVKDGGLVIGNGSDPRVVRQMKACGAEIQTYGFDEHCDWQARNYREDEKGYGIFELAFRDKVFGTVRMGIPGRFNTENALAAFAGAYAIGADMSMAIYAMETFHGAKRRFEMSAVINGTELFHDYGHNPTEIRNTIAIAKKRCGSGRVWAVLQPHTYSRLRTLFDDFVACTEEADITLVTDVFLARETKPDDLNAGMLVEAMKKRGVNARWTPTFDDTEKALVSGWKKGDLVITLGCGNINLLNEQIKKHFGK